VKLRMMMFTGLATIGLTACGAPSVEDFAEDPQLLQKTLGECMMTNPAKAKEDEACVNAGIAMKNMQKNMMGNIMNMMGK